jgi:uncharacterized DUF497 family protein
VEFRWNQWNIENCTKHGCSIREVEAVIENAGHGYPRKAANDKLLVIGRGQGGRVVEVFYLRDPAPEKTLYPIHAMPVSTRRRRR